MLRRNGKGASIAETAASMVLLLPILIAILFVVLESAQAYMIKEGLSQGAREAARNLAVQYGVNPAIGTSRAMQDTMVFDGIRIHDIINASAQFDDPTFDSSGTPPIVTVTIHYTSGQNGLSVFPNPDPLHLGSSFQLSATSTYRLE